jgi:hypothetical protein
LILEALIDARIEQAMEDKDYEYFGKVLDADFDAQNTLKAGVLDSNSLFSGSHSSMLAPTDESHKAV